jgi:hypothetical protein
MSFYKDKHKADLKAKSASPHAFGDPQFSFSSCSLSLLLFTTFLKIIMSSSLSLLAPLRPRVMAQTRPGAIRSFTISQHLRSDASSVASAFLSRFQSLGPQTRTQTIDANQLQLLTLTLNRPTLFPGAPSLSNAASAPQSTVPVPPGYHLAYFTPAFLESELGADGTDASYNPDVPFTRRMWAGGEVLWPRVDGKPNLLRIGQQVQETTRVLSAEPKVVKKTGEDMIVVGIEKEFANEHGVSIIDRRSVFSFQVCRSARH